MDEDVKNDVCRDWESECNRYKQLYYELEQSSQNNEERLYDENYELQSKIDDLSNENKSLRKIIQELSFLL